MKNGVNKNAIYWLLILSLPFLAIALIIAINANNRNNNLSDSKLNDGKSAYELAVDKGFEGSEEDWLNFIRGTNGSAGSSAYEVACQNGFQGTVQEWLESLTGRVGEDGESQMSDFEIAKANGFSGTLEQFLALIDDAIKGDAKGKNGEDGKDALSIVDINYDLIEGLDFNYYIVCDFIFSDGSISKKIAQVEKEIEDFTGLYPSISVNTTNPMFLVEKDHNDSTTTCELLDVRRSEFGKGGDMTPGSHGAEFRYGGLDNWEYAYYYVYESSDSDIPGGGKKGNTLNEGNKYTFYIELEKKVYAFPFLNVNDPYEWARNIDIYGYVYEMYDNGTITCTYRKLIYDKDYYINMSYQALEREYKSYKNKTVSYLKCDIVLRYRYFDELYKNGSTYTEYNSVLYFYDPEKVELVSVKAFNDRYDTKKFGRYFNMSDLSTENALKEDYLSDLYIQKIYSDGTIENVKVEEKDIISFNYPSSFSTDYSMSIEINVEGYEDFVEYPSNFTGTKKGTNSYYDYITLIKDGGTIEEVIEIPDAQGCYSNNSSYKFMGKYPTFNYTIDEINYDNSSDTLCVIKDGDSYILPSFISNFELSIPVVSYYKRYGSLYCINYTNFTLTFDELISSLVIDSIEDNIIYFHPRVTYNGETLEYKRCFKLVVIESDEVLDIRYQKYETEYHKTPYSTDPLEFACVKEKVSFSNSNYVLLERIMSLKELKENNPSAIENLDEIEIDDDGFMEVHLKGTTKRYAVCYDMFKREAGSSVLDLYIYQEGNARFDLNEYVSFNSLFNEFEVSVNSFVDEFVYLDLIMSSSIKYVHEASQYEDGNDEPYDEIYIPIKREWVNINNVPQESGRFTTPGRYEFTIKLGIFDYVLKGYINVVPDCEDKEPIKTYEVDFKGEEYDDLYCLRLNVDGEAFDKIIVKLYDNNTLTIEYMLKGLKAGSENHLYEIKDNIIILSTDKAGILSLPFIIDDDELKFIGKDPNNYDFYYKNLNGKKYYFNIINDEIVEVSMALSEGKFQKTFLFYKYDEISNTYIINSSNMRLYYKEMKIENKKVDAIQASPVMWR